MIYLFVLFMLMASAWILGQVLMYILKDRIIEWINIAEAEWHLHLIKRNKIKHHLKKERESKKIPSEKIQEVYRNEVDCPIEWCCKYTGPLEDREYETIDITNYKLIE